MNGREGRAGTAPQSALPNWNESKFRLIVESTPAAIVIVDQSGRLVFVNSKAERLFGYSRTELLGRPVEMLLPERYREGQPEYRATFKQSQSRPAGAGRDLHALRKDGREIPVEIGLETIITNDGTLLLSSIIDMTANRKAEARFRMAVEASPSAMVMVDRSGTIVLVNSQAERLFRYGREELVGQSVDMLVPARYRSRHPAIRAGYLADPKAVMLGAGRDLFGVRKDGTEVPVEIGLNPIESDEGIFVLTALLDITERKRAQEALSRYARELERSNADLQEFAAVASHDLQEPLRKIAAFGELLQSHAGEALDDESRDYLRRMQGAAQRMSNLIASLLDLARVTSRAQPFRSVALAEVVEEVVGDLEIRLAQVKGKVEVGELPRIEADRLQMRQLFQNLIGNALKFATPDRAPVVSITSTRAADKSWAISVADNGIGFAESQIDRLFKPFSRLNPTSRYEGSGMGLAICRKIAGRHHGEITAHSTPGSGSVFTVILPEETAQGGG